jgi:hypothetical protein
MEKEVEFLNQLVLSMESYALKLKEALSKNNKQEIENLKKSILDIQKNISKELK